MDRSDIIVSDFTWAKLGEAIMNSSPADALIFLINHMRIVEGNKFDEVISTLKQIEIREDLLIGKEVKNKLFKRKLSDPQIKKVRIAGESITYHANKDC